MPQTPLIRIGDIGTASNLMHPSGVVLVHGARFSARSSQGVIHAGDEVVVLRGDNSGLVVLLKSDLEPGTLPNIGEVVHASFGDAVQAKGKRHAEALRRWTATRERWLRRTGLVVGMIFGLTTLFTGQQFLGWDLSVVHLAASMICGPIFGLLFLSYLDSTLRGIDFALHRISLLTCLLGLVTGLVASLIAIPQLGWTWGVLFGGVMLAIASVPLPLIVLFLSAEAAMELDGVAAGGEGTSTADLAGESVASAGD